MDQEKRERVKFFLYAITVYPLYYVGAMFLSAAILTPVLGWSLQRGIAFFLVTGGVMGMACFIIHFRLYLDAFHNAFIRK